MGDPNLPGFVEAVDKALEENAYVVPDDRYWAGLCEKLGMKDCPQGDNQDPQPIAHVQPED